MQILDGSARQLSSAPTELELQALQKLREGLSSAAGKQLRAFTSVRDIYWEGTEDSAVFHESATGMLQPSSMTGVFAKISFFQCKFQAMHLLVALIASWLPRGKQHTQSG